MNKNTNGLIKQYFTKGSSFENITESQVRGVIQKLKNRPRKTLIHLMRNFLVMIICSLHEYKSFTSEFDLPIVIYR